MSPEPFYGQIKLPANPDLQFKIAVTMFYSKKKLSIFNQIILVGILQFFSTITRKKYQW
jgi:hypothetical protein